MKVIVLFVAAALGSAGTWAWQQENQTVANSSQQQQDRREILGHIDSIFQAYIRQDREAIRRTHTPDWTGFQGPSVKIERGIADYMVNAEKSLANLQGTGYALLDTEVQIYGDIALVYYVARYDFRDKEGRTGSLPLRSLDVYRREGGQWNQCGSHITPIPQGGAWGQEIRSPSG